MHYIKSKGILSPSNTMNLYRGCTHGCIYCDSRSHCYNMTHDFEDIEIKENSIELLRDTLKTKRKKVMIKTGSMTDPYIPLEIGLKYVRSALEVVYDYGFGFSLITKSNLVLRDIDLLKKINEKAKCVVQISLTTLDDDLCKILEPNVSTTSERFEVLKVLRDNNIPTVVWICPILLYINDTFENLDGLLDYCIEAKVKGIMCFNIGLTLRDGNREYFYKQLDKHFPHLKEQYVNNFGNNYQIVSEHNKELMKHFHEKCEKNKIIHNPREVFEYVDLFETNDETEQLSLF